MISANISSIPENNYNKSLKSTRFEAPGNKIKGVRNTHNFLWGGAISSEILIG